jgi:hypothetical protein
MDVNHFPNARVLDPATGRIRLRHDMIAQALAAERPGCQRISVPEHHPVNIC